MRQPERFGPIAIRAWRAAACFCLCAVVLSGGCRSNQPSSEGAAAQNPATAAPAAPEEYTAGAKNFFGPDAEVLAFGDLALDGGEQILVANPMPGAPRDASTGITVARAAILDKQGDRWKEIFRCDEYLTNEKGFLIGAPTSPADGWRMQYAQDATSGLELRFAEATAGANQSATYVVRWNPKVKRYECVDKKSGRFLGEMPSLEEPVPRELLR